MTCATLTPRSALRPFTCKLCSERRPAFLGAARRTYVTWTYPGFADRTICWPCIVDLCSLLTEQGNLSR